MSSNETKQINPKTTPNLQHEHILHIGVGEKHLATVPSDASLLDAVAMMRHHNVGDVIVTENLDGELFPVGILTDRDLALDVLSQCADVDTMKVSSVMNKYLVTCPLGTGIFEMIKIMKEEGVNRLPIVSESGTLKGIVNAKNLMKVLVAGLHDLATISNQQIENEAHSRH